jgi:glycosyltransferase involved in cell wall biosynthesis
MRLLAVSYMLPPALYPQSIQIGRLLAYLPGEIGAVCGRPDRAGGLDNDGGLAGHLAFRLEVPYRPALSGIALNLARRFVPFYARVPDEFRHWVPVAERAVMEKLAASGFKPEALATFGDPMSDHLLGLRLKRRLGLPWLAHFSDPWVDDSFRRGQPLANLVNRRLEAQVVAVADRVVFTSAETLDLVMAKYPKAWRAKATVLPHSFDPGLYPPPAPRNGELMVRHLGNLYGHRTPVPLLVALRHLLDRAPATLDGTRFEFIGGLSFRSAHHPAWRKLPPGLVRYLPRVAHSRALALMAESDLLLVIDGPDDLSVFLLSKLIEYIGAGIPIFGILPPGASANLVERLGGIVADPRDIEAVAVALLRALELARRERKSTEPWGNADVRKELHAKRVAADFGRMLDEMVRSAQR